jgi:hypothetical protein
LLTRGRRRRRQDLNADTFVKEVSRYCSQHFVAEYTVSPSLCLSLCLSHGVSLTVSPSRCLSLCLPQVLAADAPVWVVHFHPSGGTGAELVGAVEAAAQDLLRIASFGAVTCDDPRLRELCHQQGLGVRIFPFGACAAVAPRRYPAP